MSAQAQYALDAHTQYVFDAFEKSGAGFSYVTGKDGETPSYLATYGWSVNFGLPEFIVFGDPMMLRELQRIYDELIIAVDAVPAVEDFQCWPIKCKGHPVVSVKVDPSNVTDDWFEDALAYRKRLGLSGEMPAHQVFWTDRRGNFPWDEGRFSVTHRWLQPPLYQPNVRPRDMRPRKDSLRHQAEVLVLCNPSR